MMEKELEELIKDRKDLLQALTKNRFTNGLRTVLTDLYPDSAHFIYELLQNAEDMNATNVRFVLNEDGIKFEHNGTKRSFNVADINAITNIGDNEQKKQDVNSIGKFGVGFKAVFAYTSTPIIHSGQYHFKIVDYFMPEFEGVEQVPTRDSGGVEWTKFEIPFNKPQKQADVAYQQCLEGLKALDKSSILFLQHIRKIEFKFYKSGIGDGGYIERTGDEDGQEGAHTITINVKSFGLGQALPSKWLKFHKLVEIVDEKGCKKKLPISIAYSLIRDSKTNKMKICRIAGKVFIYFPAEKETSNLKFHINAPFASTVARDSVQNRSENNALMDQVAQLVGESLEKIKELGMMEKSFFEVLPNKKDELTPFYSRIFNTICLAFKTHAYLPTKDEKSFVTSDDALHGPAVLYNLFTQDDMKILFGTDKKWIINAFKSSREDDFLQSLGIETFDLDDFRHSFDNELFRVRAERVLAEKKEEWLKDFYYLCSKINKENHYGFSSAIRNIQQMMFIRSADGTMLRPSDVYILPYGEKLITKSTPIIDEYFVGSSHNSDSRNSEIRSFFKELGVRNYGPKIEIEKRLKRYQQNFDFDDVYFEDMLAFARYNNKYPGNDNHSLWRSGSAGNSVDFTKCRLFVYKVNDGEKSLCFVGYASDIYLGKAYGCSDGEELANVLGYKLLWDEYSKRYKSDELRLFVEFAKNCGIKCGLKIERRSARENPLFFRNLYDPSKRRTNTEEGSDYYVPELEVLLNKISPSISRVIWNLLLKEGESNIPAYWLAQYKPNQSADYKCCDSTLIQQLKRAKWIPQKNDDKLYAPADASIMNLPNDFVYRQGNKLLHALVIGSKASAGGQKWLKTQEAAREQGFELVTQADAKRLEVLKAREQAQAEKDAQTDKATNKSMRDRLDTKKTSTSTNDEDDCFESDGAVNNIEKRTRNIEKNFEEARGKSPLGRKLIYTVQTSSKQEKEKLRNWYHGRCQMCGTEIRGSNGERHFVARNVIRVNDLRISLRRTADLAWNSLCLCPNCATRYEVCSHDTSGLYDQIVQTEVVPGDSENIRLHIELDGKFQYISYVPKHFLTLQKAVQLIDRLYPGQEE